VRVVARVGWRLLSDYRFDPANGLWRHRAGPVEPPLRLTQVAYAPDGAMCFPRLDDRAPESALLGYLDDARAIIEADHPGRDGVAAPMSEQFEQLRWFELPASCLIG
jgi:hypothetical protein